MNTLENHEALLEELANQKVLFAVMLCSYFAAGGVNGVPTGEQVFAEEVNERRVRAYQHSVGLVVITACDNYTRRILLTIRYCKVMTV